MLSRISSPFSFFFLLFFFFLLLHATRHINADDELYDFCGTTGNYTANSTYAANLNALLANLSANGSSSGFLTATTGKVPDQVYGLILCRGDVNASTCLSCLDTASQDALQVCAYNKGATVFYDYCLLRYSNQQFLSSTDNSQEVYMWNVGNVTDVNRFDQLLNLLLNTTTNYAAYNSTKMFATGEVNFTEAASTIYGLVQCTRDLSDSECQQCLKALYSPQLPTELQGKEGGRVLGLRCNMRYEIYKFYDGNSIIKLVAPPENTTSPAPAPSPASLSPPVPASKGGMQLASRDTLINCL